LLKRILITLGLLLFCSNNYLAQNQKKIEQPSLFEVKEDSQKVNILNDVASRFIGQNLDSAFLFAKQALDLSQKISYLKGIMDAYITMGIYYDLKNDTTKALAYFKNSLELAKENNYPNEIGNAYYYLATHYNLRQQHLIAASYYDKAPKYFEEAKNFKMKGNALLLYGSAAYYANKILLSTDATKEAIKIFTELKDSLAISNALINLAITYIAIKEYNKANQYLFEAWDYLKNVNNDVTKWIISYDIANNYEQEKDYSNALRYYQQALYYAKKTKNKSYLGSSYTGLASVYYYTKNYDAALKNIETALTYREERSEFLFSAVATTVAARIYSHFNRLDEAIKYANLCLEIASKPENVLFRVEAYEVLSDIYEKKGNYPKSLEYYKIFKAANDSIYNKSVVTQLSEFQTMYETEKKVHQNAILKKQKELTEETVKRQYLFIYFISGGLVLLVAVVLLLIYLYSNKKKTNKILIQQKQEIEKLADKLTELNATKDKFFSIIAHDLKNPFHTLISLSSIFLDQEIDIPEDTKKEFLVKIAQTTRSTYELLENLLQWSRTQTGKIQFVPETINLFEIVETNISLLNNLAEDKHITLDVFVDHNIKVIADRNMLVTVYRNLMGNAIKFSYQNSKVIVRAEELNEYIVMSVKDYGIGIEDKNKSKMFNLGKTPVSVGTKDEKGTGLGLILCKEFIDMQKGKIWFESVPNEGTTFFITIPKYNCN
jgi:signal transduction histidine kinase